LQALIGSQKRSPWYTGWYTSKFCRSLLHRVACLRESGGDALGSGAFPDYINGHEDECADWQVEFDARGHMREPHGGKFFGIGTAEVREYVDSWTAGSEAEALDVLEFESKFPTSGPLNRFQAAVFVEKEGFGGLIERSWIAERYDVAFFSSKGQSTTATRKLVDELSQEGVKILVLHDFDRDGLGRPNRRNSQVKIFWTLDNASLGKSRPRCRPKRGSAFPARF